MDIDFWHARWQQGQIGFHLGHVNPNLARHHAALGDGPGSRVLVPLCGKSLDLVWLAEQRPRHPDLKFPLPSRMVLTRGATDGRFSSVISAP